MTKRLERLHRLMPNNVPRWIRVYDNAEFHEGSDRYTIVFTGNYNNIGKSRGASTECVHPYVCMGDTPTHPLGFCQHAEDKYHCVDAANPNRWPPAIGRKHENSAIGRRISFDKLPAACQAIVRADYKDLWKLWK
jgi:hypothetical protein